MSESRSKLQLIKNSAPQNLGALISSRDTSQIQTNLQPVKEISVASTLSILNLAELTEGEQFRVNELAKGVIPDGIITGVIRGMRSWDLRPLIREGSSTLILRLYGPEVMLSASYSDRALKQLQLLASLSDSNSGLIEFGTLDSQVFTLRPLYLNSLSERLSSGERFSFRLALGIALELVRILKTWQAEGIIHGHICPSNICFSATGEILIVDPGVSITQYLSCKELNALINVSDEKYIAPELVKLGVIDPRGDNYCLGLVLMELFRKVRRARDDRDYDPELERMNSSDIEAISELASGLSDLNIDVRAPLEFAERLLDSRISRPEPTPPLKQELPPDPVLEPEIEPNSILSEIEELPPSPILVEKAFDGADFESVLSQDGSNSWELGEKVLEIQPSHPVENNDIDQMVVQANFISKIIKWALVVLTLVCVFLAYRTFFGVTELEFSNLTQEELQSDWESGIPSEMALVADAAVQNPATGNAEQQKQAERIILKSAMSGDKASDTVNYPLIRLAFNEKWERKLNSSDRRVALTVALKRLIDEQYLPKEKVDFTAIHPGVIFSIMSIEGNVPGLNLIPVSKLTTLPPPINLAFQELVNVSSDVKCSDPGPLGLARFFSKELSVEEVISYLKEDTEYRLRALAILLYSERIKSKQLIEMLLNHPNLRLDHELVRWGIKVNLTNWGEVDSSGQLFILAGLPATSQLSPAEYVQMLAHPIARTRQVAIEKIVNLIPLAHPGAVPFLSRLKERPELLTGKQTLELAQFLEKPSLATKEAVQNWCETSPNPNVMAELLASTARQSNGTPFDSNLSLCLQRSNWKPSTDLLRRLSMHPDDLTRIFVYTQLAELGKQEPNTALSIFSEALATEKREDLKRQIQLNISSLKLSR